MLKKSLFVLAHQAQYPKFHSCYKHIVKNQWNTYDYQKEQQEKQLRYMIKFAYQNIPYYHKLFKGLKITPHDILTINDLEKLPVMTKDIIIDNWEDLKPLTLSSMKYSNQTTGGSTGVPLKYRLLKSDRFLGAALLYRGWNYTGYELGDKMIFLGGSSIGTVNKSTVTHKIHEVVRNLKLFSSFDMGLEDMQSYVDQINSFKPKFLRGYPTSISFLSDYIHSNNLNITQVNAIYTTSEKLLPHAVKKIEDTFDCNVYDNYGLHDGGVGAYQCSEKDGYHIDTERAIMEIVDDSGKQINDGLGRILATSLNNFAMPFIRYDTGDLGHVIEDQCSCGRKSKLLKEIVGRQQEMLQTPEGKFVHGQFFTNIFWDIKGIKEFQVIQLSLHELIIKIVPEDIFDEKQLDSIKSIIQTKSQGWNIKFNLVDSIQKTKAGKHKFVLSQLD
jgi:phenylacetate-CoA ligase